MSNLIIVAIIVFLLALNNSKIKNHAVIIMLSLLFGSRPMDVPDTVNYYDIFLYSMDDSMFHYEYGYRLLNYFCHDVLGLGFHLYLFLLSFLMLEIWYFCTRKMVPNAHISLMMLLYISFYGFYFDGVVTRNALAIMICYLGIYILFFNRKYIKYVFYVLLVLLAFTQHAAAILFLVVPFLFRKFGDKFIYGWLIVNFLLIIFSSAGFVEGILGRFIVYDEFSRFSHYGDGSYENEQGLSILFLLNFVLSIVCAVFRKTIHDDRKQVYNIFLNIFLFGVTLDCATWTLSTASRLGAQFISFSFIPLYLLFCESSLMKKQAGKVAVYLLSFAEFYALIHYFPLFLNF